MGRRRGKTDCVVIARYRGREGGREGGRRYEHGRDGGEVALIHGEEEVVLCAGQDEREGVKSVDVLLLLLLLVVMMVVGGREVVRLALLLLLSQ